MLKPINHFLFLLTIFFLPSSIYAIDNLEFEGTVNLFYGTYDDKYNNNQVGHESELFNKVSSISELGINLGAKIDFTEWLLAGGVLSAITDMGLDGELTNGTFSGQNDTKAWLNELYVGAKIGKTSAKIGRMQLDTPFLFSETWSVVPETYESVIVHNRDIPDTTLAIGYVDKYNGQYVVGGGVPAYKYDAYDGDVFADFYKGVFATGVENNSWEPLNVQAWYYAVDSDPSDDKSLGLSGIQSIWLQTDMNLDGILAGFQYSFTEYDYAQNSDNYMFGLMAGYEMKDTFVAKISFTQVGNDKVNHAGAGENLGGSQSGLYSEAWWEYGVVVLNNTNAFNLTLTAPLKGFDLGAYFTHAINKNAFAAGTALEDDAKLSELTLELLKSFEFKEPYGGLDIGFHYLYTKYDNDNQPTPTQKGKAYNSLHFDFTYAF